MHHGGQKFQHLKEIIRQKTSQQKRLDNNSIVGQPSANGVRKIKIDSSRIKAIHKNKVSIIPKKEPEQ